MIKPCKILSIPILLALSAVGQAQAFSNDCSLQFAGSYRKAVKNHFFLDAEHGKTCKIKRGMVNQGVTGAEGAWEIHPVLSVELVNQ